MKPKVTHVHESYLFGSKQSLLSFYTDHIGPENDRYMDRYILRTPLGSARFHTIWRSDREPHLHDHPMKLRILIVRGGYWEVLPHPQALERGTSETIRVWRSAGSMRTIGLGQMHKVELEGPDPVYTIVWGSRSTTQWGYYVGGFRRENWVPAREYLQHYNAGQADEHDG